MPFYRQLLLIHDKFCKEQNIPIFKIIEVYAKPFSKLDLERNNIAYAVCCNENAIHGVQFLFDNKYIKRNDIGNNHYYGNYKEMIKDINIVNKFTGNNVLF